MSGMHKPNKAPMTQQQRWDALPASTRAAAQANAQFFLDNAIKAGETAAKWVNEYREEQARDAADGWGDE